jgi:hypothetical protein
MRHTSSKRYAMKLVHGALFLQGCRVDGLIDDDHREIRVSDLLTTVDRLTVAAEAKRLVALYPARHNPSAVFHVLPTCHHPLPAQS